MLTNGGANSWHRSRARYRTIALCAAGAVLFAVGSAAAQEWHFVAGPKIGCKTLKFYGAESALLYGTVYDDVGEQGGVFRTTDGGKSFAPVSTPDSFDLRQVRFVGSQVIVAIGVDTTVRPQDQVTSMQRSDDGGAGWESIEYPADGDGTLSFSDAQNGLFVGVNDSGVWSTDDGGRHWTAGAEAPPDYDQSVRDAWSMMPNSSGFFVPDGSLVQGQRAVYGSKTRLGTTVDGGTSWNFFDLDDGSSGGGLKSPLNAADFVSDDVAYVLVGYGLPYQTSDGGQTWQSIPFADRPMGTTFKLHNDCFDALTEGLAYASTYFTSSSPESMMQLGDPADVTVPDLDPTADDQPGPSDSNDTAGDADAGDTTASAGSDAGSQSTGSDVGSPSAGSDAGSPSAGSDAGSQSTGSDAGSQGTGSDVGSQSTGSDVGSPSAGSDAGSESAGSDRASNDAQKSSDSGGGGGCSIVVGSGSGGLGVGLFALALGLAAAGRRRRASGRSSY
jgi:hypothetical protein